MKGSVDIDTLPPKVREILELNEPTFTETLIDFALGFLSMGIIIAVAAVLNYYIDNEYFNILFGIICGLCGFVATIMIFVLIIPKFKPDSNRTIRKGIFFIMIALSTFSGFFSFCEVRSAYDGPTSSFSFGFERVYVTRYGHVYHRKNCPHIKGLDAMPTFKFLTFKRACLDCKP